MGPPGTEFTHGLGRAAGNTGCFGGNCHLVVHDAQHGGFQDLGLKQWGNHCYKGLAGECYLSFFHSVHIPGKTHRCEHPAEVCIVFTGKEFSEKRFRLCPKSFNHFQDLIDTAYHSPVVVIGCCTVKHIEYGHSFIQSFI